MVKHKLVKPGIHQLLTSSYIPSFLKLLLSVILAFVWSVQSQELLADVCMHIDTIELLNKFHCLYLPHMV